MHVAFIMIMAKEENDHFTIAEKVSQIGQVEFAYPVTGPYDIIAYVKIGREFALLDRLKSITEEIRTWEGVEDTLLCLQRARENSCVEIFGED